MHSRRTDLGATPLSLSPSLTVLGLKSSSALPIRSSAPSIHCLSTHCRPRLRARRRPLASTRVAALTSVHAAAHSTPCALSPPPPCAPPLMSPCAPPPASLPPLPLSLSLSSYRRSNRRYGVTFHAWGVHSTPIPSNQLLGALDGHHTGSSRGVVDE
jgi:hypothetical protein